MIRRPSRTLFSSKAARNDAEGRPNLDQIRYTELRTENLLKKRKCKNYVAQVIYCYEGIFVLKIEQTYVEIDI
jgi:hypothetical protein